MPNTYFTPINTDEMLADSMQATAQQKVIDLYFVTDDMLVFENGRYCIVGETDDNTTMVGTDTFLYFKSYGTVIKTESQVIDEDTMQVIDTLAYFKELKEIREDLIVEPIMQVIVTKTPKKLPTFGIDTFIEGFECIILP